MKNYLSILTQSPAPSGTGSTNPTSSGLSFLEKAVGWVTDWGWIIALLCLVVSAIILMIPSEQSSQKAKKYIVCILIAVAILTMGPSVIEGIRYGI